MRILMLGATGSIGQPLLAELLDNGHSVVCLARSDIAEERLRSMRADIIRGDLRAPELWSDAVRDVDATIHVAATFTDDMGDIDRAVIAALIKSAAKTSGRSRFIYTGGCWLYGATYDGVATETTALSPIPAFKWMTEHAELLEHAGCFAVNVVHPAMVYDENGGVFTRFFENAKRGDPVEVWGSLHTRWPLVHRLDLASAYRLIVESGVAGQSYNVAAEKGVFVRDIVEAIMGRYAIATPPVVRSVQDVVAEHGDWALGPTLDQQMSAKKISTELGWSFRFADAVSLIEMNDAA